MKHVKRNLSARIIHLRHNSLFEDFLSPMQYIYQHRVFETLKQAIPFNKVEDHVIP